jgi:hypothetical protein
LLAIIVTACGSGSTAPAASAMLVFVLIVALIGRPVVTPLAPPRSVANLARAMTGPIGDWKSTVEVVGFVYAVGEVGGGPRAIIIDGTSLRQVHLEDLTVVAPDEASDEK